MWKSGTATTEPIVMVAPSCGAPPAYALKLTSFSSHSGTHDNFHAAEANARDAYAAAEEAAERGEYLVAARQFLACAKAYRAVPDTADPSELEPATENARSCYRNAFSHYAAAGRYAAEGRPELERAAAEDARNAELIRAELAEARTDCPATR